MKIIENQKLENSKIELKIQVEKEEFAAAVERSIEKNSKEINVPGFRKGKAPRAMIIKRYGIEAFYEDAINECYPAAYVKALDEIDAEPVERADIEIDEVTEDGFMFKATVSVKPEVTLGEYKGISAEKTVAVVEEEEIENELARLSDRNSRVITVEGRAAKDGDITTIDFEGFIDDVPFDGGKGGNFTLTLGSGQFIPGFEEQVVGHNTGDEFDVNVSFPEDYHAEELKGKPAVFKVKLHEIKAKETPEIDDEFAKDVSEFDTLAELKEDIKTKLITSKETAAQEQFENKLMETVATNMTADIPQVMFESRIDEMAADFDSRLQMQGLNLQTYLQYTQSDMETFRKSFAAQAEAQVKTRLAMEKIAEVEGFTATAEEIEAEYEKVAAHYGVDAARAKQAISSAAIEKDIVCSKAIDLVRDTAVVAPAEKAKAEKKASKKAKEDKEPKEKEEKEAKKKKAKKSDDK